MAYEFLFAFHLYLVPFVRYSPSNNDLILKSGLEVIENGTIRKVG